MSVADWRDLSVVLLAFEGVVIGLVLLAALAISARLLGQARGLAHTQMRVAHKMMLGVERQVDATTIQVVSPVINVIAAGRGASVTLHRLRQIFRRR